MRILSFDTSTNEIHAALLSDDRVHIEREIKSDQSDGKTRQECVALLMPAIDEIMKASGWRKADLDLLVVGQGPGSFTGIRTGVVTGRTLAQALKLPLIPVSNLECYAFAHSAPTGVILSAGRQRFFVAVYDLLASAEARIETLIAPICLDQAEAIASLDRASTWVCDQASMAELAPYHRGIQSLPKVKNIATKQAQIALARLSLRLAGRELAGGSFATTPAEAGNDRQPSSDLGSLLNDFPYQRVQPLYLRSPSVTIKKNCDSK